MTEDRTTRLEEDIPSTVFLRNKERVDTNGRYFLHISSPYAAL